MDNKTKHILCLIEDSLRDALDDLRGLEASSARSNKTLFKRLIYDAKHNMVAVEIARNQLPTRLFETGSMKQSLLAQSSCNWLDILDLGENVYFYFGLAATVNGESVAALRLAYVL